MQRLVMYCDVCRTEENVTGIHHTLPIETVTVGHPAINGVQFLVRISIDNSKVPELCPACAKKILLAACKQAIAGE